MGLAQRGLELRRPSLTASAAVLVLVVELVTGHGASKVSPNEIKSPWFSPSPSFACHHRHPLHPCLLHHVLAGAGRHAHFNRPPPPLPRRGAVHNHPVRSLAQLTSMATSANILSPVEHNQHLQLKILNPRQHWPVRQSRGALAVLSECNKEDPRCLWRCQLSLAAQHPLWRYHPCLLHHSYEFVCVHLSHWTDSFVVAQKLQPLLGGKIPIFILCFNVQYNRVLKYKDTPPACQATFFLVRRTSGCVLPLCQLGCIVCISI
ncbi:hypothetical protein SETIT_2G165300v2 [Setaria italica]|uniref:Uncharacterized protein n=1 Tax=Setaria italica TaxID=4555 RepID=A0A368PZD4_SETIT|nr:hypothetical protein SETIT_2G165300v2 [Setaria italica]